MLRPRLAHPCDAAAKAFDQPFFKGKSPKTPKRANIPSPQKDASVFSLVLQVIHVHYPKPAVNTSFGFLRLGYLEILVSFHGFCCNEGVQNLWKSKNKEPRIACFYLPAKSWPQKTLRTSLLNKVTFFNFNPKTDGPNKNSKKPNVSTQVQNETNKTNRPSPEVFGPGDLQRRGLWCLWRRLGGKSVFGPGSEFGPGVIITGCQDVPSHLPLRFLIPFGELCRLRTSNWIINILLLHGVESLPWNRICWILHLWKVTPIDLNQNTKKNQDTLFSKSKTTRKPKKH